MEDTWEGRIVEMFGGLKKMGHRTEINFHSTSITTLSQYFRKPAGGDYGAGGGKDCRILEALRLEEDPLKIQGSMFRSDRRTTAEYCSVDKEISKVSSTRTLSSAAPPGELHRLFHLTFSRLCNSWQYESQPRWIKNLGYWLRKNLLYPSELHYVARTILIAAITTEVLLRTATRLNLDLKQLVMDSGIQLVCLSGGLCGIYKEFHFF